MITSIILLFIYFRFIGINIVSIMKFKNWLNNIMLNWFLLKEFSIRIKLQPILFNNGIRYICILIFSILFWARMQSTPAFICIKIILIKLQLILFIFLFFIVLILILLTVKTVSFILITTFRKWWFITYIRIWNVSFLALWIWSGCLFSFFLMNYIFYFFIMFFYFYIFIILIRMIYKYFTFLN